MRASDTGLSATTTNSGLFDEARTKPQLPSSTVKRIPLTAFISAIAWPASGTLAAVASGHCRTLIERAAEVTLKEHRPLLLVPRETPLSIIQLENMLRLARAGAVILPANPGFYHRPKTVQELVDFVVARILDHLGIEQRLVPAWGSQAHD